MNKNLVFFILVYMFYGLLVCRGGVNNMIIILLLDLLEIGIGGFNYL